MESWSQVMSSFNYDNVAELFPANNVAALLPAGVRRVGRQPSGYGRFARAAYAIRFAIEELPADILLGTCLRVDGQIFDGGEIRQLYESESYPFIRRTPAPGASNILPWKRKSRLSSSAE
jgi:hypothetical protein